MLRKMELVKGNCACCGETQIFDICNYQEINNNKATLAEYLDYIFINVNVCSCCGYVNNDLSKSIGEHPKDIVESQNYKNLLNNVFFEKYKNLYGEYYKKYNCGKYEALVLLYEKNHVINFEYLKILNYIYQIKTSIRSEYFEDRCDIDDEKENAEYDQLISNLTKQIDDLNKKMIYYVMELQPENIYSKILFAQIFSRNNQLSLAKETLNEILLQFEIDDELQEFFKEITSGVEII